MEKIFITERLVLRPISEEDFSGLHVLWSEASDKDDYMQVDSEKIFSVIEKLQKMNRGVFWTLREKKQGGIIIGTCEFNKLDFLHGCAEVGCELGLNFQKQGYMREVLREIIKYAFSKLGLTYLVARIKHDNYSSIRLFESLGFTESSSSDDVEANKALKKFFLCSDRYFKNMMVEYDDKKI